MALRGRKQNNVILHVPQIRLISVGILFSRYTIESDTGIYEKPHEHISNDYVSTDELMMAA